MDNYAAILAVKAFAIVPEKSRRPRRCADFKQEANMRIAIAVAVLGLATASMSVAALAKPNDFAAAMDDAMSRMHDAMASGYTGSADQDFAKMMIPHHQGAIEMAEIELRFGKDERLRRLAQGMIVEQRQEVAVMKDVIAGAVPSSSTIPSTNHAHHGAHP